MNTQIKQEVKTLLDKVLPKIHSSAFYFDEQFKRVKNKDAFNVYIRTDGCKALENVYRRRDTSLLEKILSKGGLELVKVKGGCASWSIDIVITKKVN